MLLKKAIGKFFKLNIDVYISSSTTNSYGEVINTWSKDRTVAGRIRSLTGNESFVAGSEHQISTHRLYTNDFNISESNRIIFGSNTFDVIFVKNPMSFDQFCEVDLQLVK